MQVEKIDIHDDIVASGIAQLHDKAERQDAPEGPRLPQAIKLGAWRHPQEGEVKVHYIVRDAGIVAGHMQLRVPQRENLHILEMDLLVHPDFRRRGIGTALLNEAISYIKADGRTQILADAPKQWEGGPYRPDSGQKFAHKHGLRPAQIEVGRRALVDYMDPTTERALLDEAQKAANADYLIESWRGPAPHSRVEALARLTSTIIDEIPLGDIEFESQEFDVDRLRKSEKVMHNRGFDHLVSIAVHRETDAVVGLTKLVVPKVSAQHALQLVTIVAPEHRGYRLGVYVKLANLRQLRKEFPQVDTVYTDNADTNIHMRSINEKMGFQEFSAAICFKLDLDDQ